MRRIAFRILLTIIALVSLGLVRVAQAREPVPDSDFPLSISGCGFLIDVAVVSNNEFKDVTMLSDGTTVTKITGTLVLRFTNASTPVSWAHAAMIAVASRYPVETDMPK